jgi:hypothetical protein
MRRTYSYAAVTKDEAQRNPFGIAQGREPVERQADFLRDRHFLNSKNDDLKITKVCFLHLTDINYD